MPKTKKAAVRKSVKKVKKPAKECCCCCEKEIEGKPIGKITHYFSNIEVAVIELTSPLKEGDKIRIVGGESTDFEQEVDSMQVDHKPVKSAKKGDDIGIKVAEKVHEGYKVYKV